MVEFADVFPAYCCVKLDQTMSFVADHLLYFAICFQDKEPYISKRTSALVKGGIVNALVAFGKSDSENSNELLSRYV
jgi:hypothetical protein